MPFALVIAIIALSMSVLVMAAPRLPQIEFVASVSVMGFMPTAMFLMFVVAVAALFDQTTLVMLPVYGLSVGLTEAVLATAIGVMVLGNITLQFGIGWLADAWSRQGMLVLLCGLVIVGSFLLPPASAHYASLWVLVFFWGAAGYGTYTIALVELGDRYSGSTLLVANAAFAVMWGIGGISGPPVVGAVMDAIGPNGLPYLLAGLFAVLLVATVTRYPARN